MTQNSMCERKGQFQLYFPWYFLNTSHNIFFLIAWFFQFKNRQGFGKCCLPLKNMGVAYNHALYVLEQGVSDAATKGAELGKTLIWHFSKPQLKRAVLLFLRFQMLIAAGYLSSALVKAFNKTKVLQQSIFTVQQMSWRLSILLGIMELSSWWAIVVGSGPLMVINRSHMTDVGSLTIETLVAVSAGCSILAVLGCDLKKVTRYFTSEQAQQWQWEGQVPDQGQMHTHTLRGTAFRRAGIYKILSCPNRLMFQGISQDTVPTL